MSIERLAELARREREAVAARRWEALLEVRSEQLELLAALRGRLTPEALPVLELALARCHETERLLFGALAERQGVIERLRARRRAFGGYLGGARGAGRIEIRA